MPVISKWGDLVMRIMFTQQLGVRVHAISGDNEVVLSLAPLKILQGDAPVDIRERALAWATHHRGELLAASKRYAQGKRPFAFGWSV